MPNLKGKKNSEVYRSYLTTSVESGINSELQAIVDGQGLETALKLSRNGVEVKGLIIKDIDTSSSIDVAVIGSDGKIGKRRIPGFKSVNVSGSGSEDPTITITDGAGGSSSFQFVGGNGLDITRSGNTFNFSTGSKINVIDSPTTLSAADEKYIHIVDGDLLDGKTITLPTPQKGLVFRFRISVADSKAFFISCSDNSKGDAQYIYGGVTVVSIVSADKVARQVVRKSTSSGTPASYNRLTIASSISASGGNEGDEIELIGLSSTEWLVRANLSTLNAAPASIAVIGA